MPACLRALLAAALLLAAAPASAFPAFARQYGTDCTACHEAWPKLNDQGVAFRDHGYQWGTGADSLASSPPGYWPISFRTTLGAQFTSLDNQQVTAGTEHGAVEKGPVGAGAAVVTSNGSLLTTVQTARLGFTGVDILIGGVLAPDITFLAILEPFLNDAGFAPAGLALTLPASAPGATPGEPGFMQALWVRFDDLFGSGWLNLKVGRGELDLPIDEERSLTPITPYAIYHYHPGGPANTLPFELGLYPYQVSLEGHDDGSRTRYSISYLQTDDATGLFTFSSPGAYAHVQRLFRISDDDRGLDEIRAGLFGLAGAYPVQVLTIDRAVSAGGSTLSTAIVNQGFFREGADLTVDLGSLSTPLALEAVWMAGEEAANLVTGGRREALYHGGFIEADWTPRLDLTFVGRWDAIRNLEQADPLKPANYLDSNFGTVAARYTLALLARTATTLHAEISYGRLRGAGYLGNDLDSWLAFGGVDLAF